MLPTLLGFVVKWSKDAQRYYIVRDTFNIEFTNEPKTRENLAMFDKQVDDLEQLPADEDQRRGQLGVEP